MPDCDPVGLPELAERLGVSAATPRAWRQRGLLPPADYVVYGRDVYDWHTILRWAGLTGRIQSTKAADEYRDTFEAEPVTPRLGGPLNDDDVQDAIDVARSRPKRAKARVRLHRAKGQQ